ncbi:AsmA family protein [Novilysobacter erysipheiresistens]|uniref:AsmA family protein n=1 Tax=Novilysobacter erysipheiresistens TaxID=1749332 RepID=A0ABU7YUD2_9GAMM
MGATPAPAEPPQRIRRRWRLIIAKGAGLALLLMLLLSLSWMTRPRQVADLILDRLGAALDLQISSSGAAEYHLRGTPRLVVRDVVARQSGAETPLLTAERIYLSLPWSTLRSVGSDAGGLDLTVRRVEVDAPRLDLAALQRWREGRPPAAEVQIPTLTDGLRIVRGTVIGDGWSVDRLGIDLPALHPEQALAARVGGRFVNGDTTVPFDLQLALTRPALDAGLGASGIATVATPDWRMPMRLHLSGRLHDGDDGVGLDGFKFGAEARYLGGDQPLPFVYGLAGPLRYDDGRFTIAPLGAVLRGDGVVPDFVAHGAFAWQDALSLRLDGALVAWPNGWPTLPPPLGQSDSTMTFKLDYRGPANLSGNTGLQLRRDETRFDVDFRLPRVLDWLDQLATGTPLPPLDGRLSTPRLEIYGAVLEGVEIEFEDAGATP